MIVIVGIGPGPMALLTPDARETLLDADRILFRLTGHPVYEWLRERGKDVVALDFVYDIPRISYEHVYGLITDIVVREARIRGRAVYAVPGHPNIFEATTGLIVERARAENIAARVIPGLSFLELMYAELRIDPPADLQVASAFDFEDDTPALDSTKDIIVAQLFAAAQPNERSTARLGCAVARWVAGRYPATHPISLVWSTGKPDYGTRSSTVPREAFESECERIRPSAPLASVYIPRTKK